MAKICRQENLEREQMELYTAFMYWVEGSMDQLYILYRKNAMTSLFLASVIFKLTILVFPLEFLFPF